MRTSDGHPALAPLFSQHKRPGTRPQRFFPSPHPRGLPATFLGTPARQGAPPTPTRPLLQTGQQQRPASWLADTGGLSPGPDPTAWCFRLTGPPAEPRSRALVPLPGPEASPGPGGRSQPVSSSHPAPSGVLPLQFSLTSPLLAQLRPPLSLGYKLLVTHLQPLSGFPSLWGLPQGPDVTSGGHRARPATLWTWRAARPVPPDGSTVLS